MIADAVRDIPGIRVALVVPPVANDVPHTLIHWNELQLKLTGAQMKQWLADGDPPFATGRVHGTVSEGFLVSRFLLQYGEDEIVGARIRQLLRQATS